MWYTVSLFRDEAEAARVVNGVVVPLLTRWFSEDSRIRGTYLRRGYDGMAYARVHMETDGSSGALEEIHTFAAELRSKSYVLPRAETGHEHVRERADEVLGNYEIRSLRESPERAHNEVLVSPDDTSADSYGGPAGLTMLRQYLASNTKLLCTVAGSRQFTQGDDLRGPLRWLGFEQLLYAVHTLKLAEGLDNSYLSLRSHVEGFIASRSGREKETLRSGLDAAFERARPALLSSAKQYWTTETSPDPILEDWLSVLNRIREEAFTACLDGTLRPPQLEDYAQRRQLRGRASVHRQGAVQSDYHRHWAKSTDAERYESSAEFQARRFMLNLVYEGLQQLGITPLERYSLCYCVARAVEEAADEVVESTA